MKNWSKLFYSQGYDDDGEDGKDDNDKGDIVILAILTIVFIALWITYINLSLSLVPHMTYL